MQYLFGDTDLAAQRHRLLADVFAESSRAFLLDAVEHRPDLAVDLGCGPGYSTHLLAESLRPARTAGFDSSKNYISTAQKTQTSSVSFHLHDVTKVPFPTVPSDLLHCRLLLTHLREPQAVVRRWATQLRPKGLLLMEEVESINTTSPGFSTYLSILETLLKHQGNLLYVGPVLDRLEDTDALRRRLSRVQPVKVPTNVAARLFYFSLQTWKHNPFVRDNYSTAMIDQLQDDLKRLTDDSGGSSEIKWGMRQLVFERRS